MTFLLKKTTFLLSPIFVLISWAGNYSIAARVILAKLEASVNGAPLFSYDVAKFDETEPLRRKIDPLYPTTDLSKQGIAAPTKEKVKYLIGEKLILQKFPVSEKERDDEVKSVQTNNGLDREGMIAYLAKQGFKFADYLELVPPGISKRNLIDREIRPRINITDDDVKNEFYNKEVPTGPRAFRLQIITVDFKNYKTAAAANARAVDALKSIKGGEKFEEVAKRVSDDPSASLGGELGVLTEDQMAPMIRSVASKLKIGETSEILGSKSAGKLFILKLMDIKSSESERLDRIKEEIKNRLYIAEIQHQLSLYLDRELQTAFVRFAGEPSFKEEAPEKEPPVSAK